MQKLYNVVMISENTFKKEITLPIGKYCINNIDTIENNKNIISLDLPVICSSLKYIEMELSESHYTVICETQDNELIKKDISYNSPFHHAGELLFSVKKHHDAWCKNIVSEKETASRHRGLLRFSLPLILILSATLIIALVLWQPDNKSGNNKPEHDHHHIIQKHIKNNEYIASNNNILLFTSADSIINRIKNDLPDYNIYRMDRERLKINKDDIILTPEFNHRKEIIHIHKNDKVINTLLIPDKFREDITIRTLSFSDITRLINNHLKGRLVWYSVTKSDNTIFIYADKRRGKETDNIIKDINNEIFSAPGNTLVQYRESVPYEMTPGMYGSLNYTYLSENHIKFISDNR